MPQNAKVPPAGTTTSTNSNQSTFDAAVDKRADAHRADRAARRRVDAEERPPVTYPPVQPLKTLLSKNLGTQQFRIENVLPANGRAILAAQFKAGKTTVIGNLIRSLVDNVPFLGAFDVLVPATNVVLVDDEMSERQIQQWLEDQGIKNPDRVVDVVCLRGNLGAFNLLDPKCREIWAKRFKNLGADYLVLDCLRPMLDALGLSEDKETGQFLGAFDALLYEAGIPDATLVHHMGHQNERSRGDSRLVDWPDVTLKLVRDGDTAHAPRYFSCLGRDAAVAEGKLSFDKTTRHLTYASVSRGDEVLDAVILAVLKLLAADLKAGNPGMSGRAIADELYKDGYAKAKTRAAIDREFGDWVVSRISKVTGGPRGSHLHRIKDPCATCGMPVSMGAATHFTCPAGGGP